MLQIEQHAQTMVRLIEELLSVSRTLKESWILGQLPESKVLEDPTIGITDKINTVLAKVLGSEEYDEEVELEEENVVDEEEEVVAASVDQDNDDNKIKQEGTKEEVEVKSEFKTEEEEVKKEDEVEENKVIEVKDEPKEEDNKDKELSKHEENSDQQADRNNDDQTNQIQNQPDPFENMQADEIMDIGTDNTNFDELDFESFGNMDQNNDDDNNDVIMIE